MTGQASSSPPLLYGVDLDDRRQQQSAVRLDMSNDHMSATFRTQTQREEREGESKNRTKRGKNERGGPRPDNRERSQRRREQEDERRTAYSAFSAWLAPFSALVTLRFPAVFFSLT